VLLEIAEESATDDLHARQVVAGSDVGKPVENFGRR
jgi:hypothetical protein